MMHTKKFYYSNNIKMVQYDERTLDLYVTFKGKAGERESLYKYVGVSNDDGFGLINSNKPGVFHRNTIMIKHEGQRL